MSVDTNDIAVALGRTAPDPGSPEWAQWDMWIGDARLLIEARCGDLEELDEAKLDYVVREAVVAHVRRPGDETRVEVAVDDGRTSRQYSSSKGRVFIRDEWWALLLPEQSSGAFTLDMLSTASIHQPWCAIEMGANYCSCGADIAGYPLYEYG